MPEPSLIRRGLVALMNAAPSSASARFGTSTRSARIFRPLVNALLPKGRTTVVVRSGAARGIRIEIDPQREKFYWSGRYEVAVQRAFADVLRPGATVWDIGAHIGFFSALAARYIGPGGRVHAFEPLPANRLRLLQTIALNNLETVEVHPTAVASRAGTRQLHQHSSTSMWSLVESAPANGIEVPCVTLDQLLAERSFGTPTLIKIDVEGAELDILRGGTRTIVETNAVLVIEFHEPGDVAKARSLLPGCTFESLSHNHWLLRGR